MTYLDCLLAALGALRVNAMRSVLTMLGVIIGVAAVIIMVAVGAGAEAGVAERMRSLGSNLFIIMPGSVTSRGARLGHGTGLSLTEGDTAAIGDEISVVQASAAMVSGGAQVVAGNLNWSTRVWGVTRDYFQVREWVLAGGREFSAGEARSAAKVAVLGDTVAAQLFPDQEPLGQTIRVGKVPFQVIGLLEKKGQSFGGRDQDDVILVPLATAKKRVLGGSRFKGDAVRAVLVKVRYADDMALAEQDIGDLLRRRHRIQPGQDDDFHMRNLAEIQQAREAASRILTLLLSAVASISLLVGGIGIMNIMLVSVTERTREIGIRMAMGAARRDIQTQFLVEAVTLSVIGGAIGIAIGVLGAFGIAQFADWPTLIRADSIVVAFLSAGSVGIFFGFYPARKASRLDPIEALRHE